MSERITVEAPLAPAYIGVVRLIVGGVAAQADLGFDAMDDLQLAVERLLVEAGADGRVRIDCEHDGRSVRITIGPLSTPALATALQQPEAAAGALGLTRVLAATVDSYGVEQVDDNGSVVVRLEKLAGGAG